MPESRAPKLSSAPSSPFGVIRNRISLLLLAALPACSVSLNLGGNLDFMERLRAAAVESDGNKMIYVKDAASTIILKAIDNPRGDGKIIEGVITIARYSDLHQLPEETVQYYLEEEDSPWKRLVVQPSGEITLRTDKDQLVLKFACDREGVTEADQLFCDGDEFDPRQAANEAAQETKKKDDETDDMDDLLDFDDLLADMDEEGDKKDEADESATPLKKPEKNQEPLPTAFPNVHIGGDKRIGALFGPVLDALAQVNFETLKPIAYELAGEHWKLAMDNLINGIEQGKVPKRKMTEALLMLLEDNPDIIPEIAKKLGIKLPASIFKKPSDAPEAKSSAEASKPATPEGLDLNSEELRRLRDQLKRHVKDLEEANREFQRVGEKLRKRMRK